jgi:hypothetical protein
LLLRGTRILGDAVKGAQQVRDAFLRNSSASTRDDWPAGGNSQPLQDVATAARNVWRDLHTVVYPNDATAWNEAHLAMATGDIIAHGDDDVAPYSGEAHEQPLRKPAKEARCFSLSRSMIMNDEVPRPRPSQSWVGPAPRRPIDEVYDPNLIAPNELAHRAA